MSEIYLPSAYETVEVREELEGHTDVTERSDDCEIVRGWFDFRLEILAQKTSSFSYNVVIAVSWNRTFMRSSFQIVAVLII
jgi:hypothetical protein